MKKIEKIGFVLFFIFLFPIYIVSASTNTNIRTEQDYKVEPWVEVTDSNRGNILATPSVHAEEKIYDFADLYTESEEEELYQELTEYTNSYHMDLVIVTINENNKSSPREYADDFYDYNQFGIGKNRDGVLFLIDMENREIYMSTTGSAIKMYHDARIDRALNSVYQYMTDKEYYKGTSNYIKLIKEDAEKGIPGSQKMSVGTVFLISLLIGAVITAIVIGVLIRKNKLARKATTAEEYLDQDSVDIKNIGDILVSTNTVRTVIEHDTSSGSSTHSGSSGASHGGGGHRF